MSVVFTKRGPGLNVLLLCDYQPRIAATVRDHIEALERSSRHRYFRLAMLGDIPGSVNLDRFDVVIIHYTLVACHERYLTMQARKRLREYTGLKAIFIQDEYRHVNESIAAMRDIGVHILFTCVPESEIEKVYSWTSLPGVRKVNVLTGYVPKRLIERDFPLPSRRQPIVGYRGRKVPAWLGDLGQEKYWIGIRFRRDAEKYKNIRCDISFREEDRLYGDAWLDFLLRCRAVLGVESGASVFDFTGELQRKVDADLRENPALDYETLKQRYFANLEGRILLAQVSPRCFESAALRTIMVLYPGDYSGRLKPWRHYIPLEKDHSNMDEVVEAICDGDLCDEMAECAYREVALAEQNAYEGFVKLVDDAMEKAFRPEMAAPAEAYSELQFRRDVALDFMTLKRRAWRSLLTYIHFVTFRVMLGWANPETRDWVHARLKWIYYTVTFYKWRTRHRNA